MIENARERGDHETVRRLVHAVVVPDEIATIQRAAWAAAKVAIAVAPVMPELPPRTRGTRRPR